MSADTLNHRSRNLQQLAEARTELASYDEKVARMKADIAELEGSSSGIDYALGITDALPVAETP